jgi:hypothetical protein
LCYDCEDQSLCYADMTRRYAYKRYTSQDSMHTMDTPHNVAVHTIDRASQRRCKIALVYALYALYAYLAATLWGSVGDCLEHARMPAHYGDTWVEVACTLWRYMYRHTMAIHVLKFHLEGETWRYMWRYMCGDTCVEVACTLWRYMYRHTMAIHVLKFHLEGETWRYMWRYMCGDTCV